MNKDILILGKGYIGARLGEALNARAIEVKIKGLKDVDRIIKKYKPKTIINCIGRTGRRNVDDCEINPDATMDANTFIPILLAEEAIRHGIKLVHISSGCIYHYTYGKDTPIKEEKVPDYFDLYYSRSKIYAEHVLKGLSAFHNILILRIRIPLDDRPNPKNLLSKLIKYKRIIDIPNSVTYVPDFLKATKHLLRHNARGIYNIAVKGALKYPKLMDAYKREKPGFKYTKIKNNKLGLMRTNLVLSTRKLEKSGFKVRNINEVVEECISKYVTY